MISYEALDGGHAEDALNYLSGGLVHEYDLSSADSVPADLWTELLNTIPLGSEHPAFMCCSLNSSISTAEAKMQGLVSGHAYSCVHAQGAMFPADDDVRDRDLLLVFNFRFVVGHNGCRQTSRSNRNFDWCAPGEAAQPMGVRTASIFTSNTSW